MRKGSEYILIKNFVNIIYSVLLKFTTKNPHIKKVLVDKYGMHVYTMSGRTKGSIVERFNRTIKQRIGMFDFRFSNRLFDFRS